VLTYPKVRSAPVLENRHFRLALTQLTAQPSQERPCPLPIF
jgi:hypothetical protein